MNDPAPITTDTLLASRAPLAAAGFSTAEVAAGLDALARADVRNASRFDTAPRCGHADGCTNVATHQTSRPATPDEAAAHWTNVERNIREAGTPEYVQDRTDTVTIAVHHCDDHADPAYLEAKAREANADA